MENNIFLIDWLTFTVKGSTVEAVKALIGMPDFSTHWEQLGGCNGYPESVYYNGIRIMFGASDEMGICCNMSGQGCRSFETFGSGDWLQLLDLLFAFDSNVNITRCDLAFDDHTGVLDIYRIRQDTESGYLTSKVRKINIHSEQDADGHITGLSLYYGSPQSKIRCRIYDKALERGISDQHWVRVELQLRDGNADSALRYIHSGIKMDVVFTGVLRNYIQFREPSEFDTNKSRWEIADYWREFLDGAVPLTLWVKPGTEYNLHRVQRYVIDIAGNAIQCMVAVYGFSGFYDRLNELKPINKLPPKYQVIVDLASRAGGGIVYDETDS